VNAQPRPYYYLENFALALDWLQERYDALWAEDERAFLANFRTLPLASRALLVRMIMRRGPVFRLSRLGYDEIGCTDSALAPLAELTWVDCQPSLTVDEVLQLLTKRELAGVLGTGAGCRGLRKPDLADWLRQLRGEACSLEEWWPYAPDSVLRVRIAPLCERLRLMFFGNFRQSWAEFVLADLGIVRYERVELDRTSRAFRSREEITHFHALYRAGELLHAKAPPEDVQAAVPPPLAGCAWIASRRAQLLFNIGQRFEQRGDLMRAVSLYLDCGHPEARIRAIRSLERRGEVEEAARLLTVLESSEMSELESQRAARIRARLDRKLGRATAAARRGAACEIFHIQISQAMSPGVAVERAAVAHLSSPDAPVWFVENALINSLFGLLCWEAIFQPVPGAFFHAFHAAPADLFERDFVARRAAAFATCLAQLDDDRYRATILATFDSKAGIQMPFVAWGLITRELLELALACMPAAHLRLFFDRLLADLATNRTGLPDLIQFWPTEQRYRLIEVKGPGDRLQDNQTRWLRYCVTHRLPVSVCKVSWLP
jgi:hypothetical protein